MYLPPLNVLIRTVQYNLKEFLPLLSLSLDFLGCAKLSLKHLRDEGGNNGPWTKRLLLEDVPKGELALRVTYQAMRRNISGTH